MANKLRQRVAGLGFVATSLLPWSQPTFGYTFEPGCPNKINGFNKDKHAITAGFPTPFLDKHRSFRARSNKYDVIIFGDSMVERWGDQAWHKYFGNLNAGRYGISGDRVEQMVWRIEQGELDNQDPKVVVLWGGANNAGVNTDLEIAQGMVHVAELIKKKHPKTKIIHMALFPAGKEPMTGWRRQIKCVNQKLGQVAPQATILHLGQLILDKQGFLAGDLMADMIHLNGKGYEKITPAVQKAINAALAQP